MPTPWLSWPARLACTRWSATRLASPSALPPAVTMALMMRRRASAVARMGLLDFPQTQHLGPAVHALAHLAAERLEVLGRAMRLDRRLIDVALHEHVGARRLAVMQGVELAAGLAGVDLRHQLLGDRLELLFHPGLDLERRDDTEHDGLLDMGASIWPPSPKRSGRPGEAVALLCDARPAGAVAPVDRAPRQHRDT